MFLCPSYLLLKLILSVDMQASIVILAPIIPCVQHTFYSGYGNIFSIRRFLRVSLHRQECALFVRICLRLLSASPELDQLLGQS